VEQGYVGLRSTGQKKTGQPHPGWKKKSLYKNAMNTVAGAKHISQLEFCGFVWKQGGPDGRNKDLANEYYDTFKQLISDLRTDLGNSDLPVFVLSYINDEDLANIKKLSGELPYIRTVIMAQNRAGREISNTVTVHHGLLPVNADGIHFNTEG